MDKNSEYGRIYSEICRGYSVGDSENGPIYFKHPTVAEHFSTYANYDTFLSDGRKRGLLSEKEQINEAIRGGWWNSEVESKIDLLQKTVHNLYKTRDKLLYKSQKEDIEKQIKRNEAILLTYTKERREIVGYTLEGYAQQKLTEELLIYFIYKNSDFSERLFPTREEYYNLTDGSVETIKNAFDRYSEIFKMENLKLVAAAGFFQNLVYLNDDAYSFWGEAPVKCSKFKIDVLLYGKMYKNVIRNHAENGKPIADEIIGDPEKFVGWISNQSGGTNSGSSGKAKSDGKNAVSSYVGATKQDLDHLGVKVEKIGGKSLLELAREKGGKLEKSDYLKAREG